MMGVLEHWGGLKFEGEERRRISELGFGIGEEKKEEKA